VFKPQHVSPFALQMMLPYAHAAFYLRSWDAVWGFARFLWERRKGLTTIRRTIRDIFLTPDVAKACAP
jgi:hypothetical protein